mmetsp:Transcript_2692/g.9004  ORF Transcript_2692/g.9004 Transcript_2692/m.9004 type:complete len:385 (+) Transcript_2692:1945-3099(+)
MGHRARVLQELRGPHDAHVLDALDRLRRHVRREVLVPKYSQPLLERELEPVPARDPVARPVVKVLVGNNALHALVVGVGGGGGLGQHAGGVEDVEALVLHCAHVEVIHSHNVVHVQIVLPSVGRLIPRHAVFERLHGPVQLVQVLLLRPDGQAHRTARHGREGRLDAAEVARHQRKQIRRLAKGVLELGPVPAGRGFAPVNLVAVGEQHREARLVRLDAHAVGRHDVGAVGEESDAPEALSFALGAQVARGLVQTRQLGVGGGEDGDGRGQGEGAIGRREDGQAFVGQLVVRAQGQGLVIQDERLERQLLAVELERRARRRDGATAERQLRGDQCLLLAHIKVQADRLDGVWEWRVVLPELLDRRSLLGDGGGRHECGGSSAED